MQDIAQELIKKALDQEVDDIHLLPDEEEYRFCFRTDKGLVAVDYLSIEEAEKFISYLKFQSNMDLGEKRRPQSGSYRILIAGYGEVELRLSIITNYRMQESMVIRLLQERKVCDSMELSYFPEDLEELRQFFGYKSGLILFSGPVSSGKTTTLYQLLRQELESVPKQIITMEDPVEIFEPRFLQTEINERANISYEVLIKSCLRHHPDILLIGEIRDSDTAKMAIRGALTGHLMVASVHAKDCRGVISRMNELGVTRDLLKQTLLVVSSQRLIRQKYAEGRKILFDIVKGRELYDLIEEAHLYIEPSEHSFNKKLRRACDLGYISEKSADIYQII